MYCMRSLYQCRNEEAGKVESLLHGAPAIILPELHVRDELTRCALEGGWGDWICCTKMLKAAWKKW